VDHKKWGDVILMPLVVALLGSGATYFITRTQIDSSERLAAAERDSTEKRARLDRQAKLLEIFNAKITSPNVRDQKMAILLLRVVDPDVAIQLANVIAADENSTPEVKQAAHAVLAEASRGNAFAVIASPKDLNSAVDLSRKVAAGTTDYPVEIYLTGDHGYYAVTLGGYLSLEEALKRVKFARDQKIAVDAFVWQSNQWGDNLLK
jgi:hypothetical protein